MWQYHYTDELYHYGRKGMKWGQNIFGRRKKSVSSDRKGASSDRKQGGSGGQGFIAKRRAKIQARKREEEIERRSIEIEAQKRADQRASIASVKKPRALSEMSDDEINTAINRLNLEKKYNDLMASQAPKVEAGKKVAAGFGGTLIKDSVIPAVTSVGKQVVTSALAKAANKYLDLGEEYKIYTNNKKKN